MGGRCQEVVFVFGYDLLYVLVFCWVEIVQLCFFKDSSVLLGILFVMFCGFYVQVGFWVFGFIIVFESYFIGSRRQLDSGFWQFYRLVEDKDSGFFFSIVCVFFVLQFCMLLFFFLISYRVGLGVRYQRGIWVLVRGFCRIQLMSKELVQDSWLQRGEGDIGFCFLGGGCWGLILREFI